MELHDLIAGIREGDSRAFGCLVARYRDMAFGYALTLLPQEQMAEDAVQEALLIAYTHLDRLQEPEAFGAWLRGIVRHQCSRIRRQRAPVSLEERREESRCPDEDPLQSAMMNEAREQVQRAIADLPPPLRAAVRLRYQDEQSLQEIAARLDLAVTTVNMRLHAARTRLRRRLQAMTDTIPSPHNTGRVQEAGGPLVTLQFKPDTLPPLFSRLSAGGDDTLMVAQHLGGGRVRAIAAREGAIRTPGEEIQDTGQPFTQALDLRIVQQAVDTLPQVSHNAARLPSGIKTIEVFAPLTQGGRTGVFAEWGVGVLVLLPELLRHLGEANRQTFCVFVPPIRDIRQWQEINSEVATGSYGIGVLYLPVADPLASACADAIQNLDATLILSRRLAEQAIWPSLDPLRCRSRRLEGADLSQAALAEDVRRLLRDYYRHQFSLEEEDCHVLSPEQQQQVQRARRALRFLSQPFFVAEPYTGKAGVSVTVEEAIRGFTDILAGRYDAMPAESLYMVGAAPSV